MYEKFSNYYGSSLVNSAAELEPLGLAAYPELTKFVEVVGAGIFKNGFISICSKRELVSNLGGWEYWLPSNAKIFGSSALGVFFAIDSKSIWLVDCEYGQVIESNIIATEFIDMLVEQGIRDEHLREPVFDSWSGFGDQLTNTEVLSPTPSIAFAGSWEALNLRKVNFEVYLSITAQIFSPESDTPAEVLLSPS